MTAQLVQSTNPLSDHRSVFQFHFLIAINKGLCARRSDNNRQQAHNYRQQAHNYRQQAEKYQQKANTYLHCILIVICMNAWLFLRKPKYIHELM
jgi:hypothetical protein